MKKSVEYFRLPDGTFTRSQSKSIKAWMKIADGLRTIPGVTVLGFNPGFLIRWQDKVAIELPTSFAEYLVKLQEREGLK